MKDELGQERASVTTREVVIAALFVAIVGVATWTVALPALDQDSTKDEGATPSTPAAPTPPAAPATPK